jgi:hypothetical protein
MAYIGKKPSDITRAIATYDTFTGDGSTTTFTLTQGAASANDLTVVVNNVRQEPGTGSKSYTLTAPTSLIFNTAPAASDEIYVINPTQVESIARAGDISSGAITGQTAETTLAAGDVVLIHDASASALRKVTNTNLTKGLDITGQTELAEAAADNDVLLIYDTSATQIKKIQKSNIASTETFTSLVQDTSPQLGGNLDPNSNKIAGSLIPSTNDAFDLGATSFVWRDIYTGDLNLTNKGKDAGNEVDGSKGSWTIQEGSDDLFLINRNSGKKYKFKLEEI